MIPEISNEFCSHSVDAKREGVSSFAVLLPCSLLKHLLTRRRACFDCRERVPLVLLQAERFVTPPLRAACGVVPGCVVRSAAVAATLWSLLDTSGALS